LYFYNADSLTIIASTFSENSAAGGGGAMWIGGNTRPGPVLIANSTFTGNRAVGDGGAIAMEYGDLQLLQSTISGNDAGSDVGDGLYLEGPSAGGSSAEAAGRGRATPAATKEDGTPKDPKDPQPEGVEPQIVDEPVEITGTIISGNAGTDIGTSDSKAVAVASTNNLIGTVTAGISLASVETIMSSTPGLGPLASNGGPTQTMALLLGSPALNAGPTTVPAFPGNETDQRGAGYPRVSGGRVDIGAYEYQVPEPSFTG
jgi:predicted outer membrane repeat protein